MALEAALPHDKATPINETNWLWLRALGMIGGSTLLFLMGGRRTQD